jgi:hypothetical protein
MRGLALNLSEGGAEAAGHPRENVHGPVAPVAYDLAPGHNP